MFYSGEYTTGQLKKLMKDQVRQLANAESFQVKENYYLIRYGVKLLIFNKVSPTRWVCALDRMNR